MPREGHDGDITAPIAYFAISIHVPREGHDPAASALSGATCNFNPRAPRGARQGVKNFFSASSRISIHVPREGHDIGILHISVLRRYFNPRAPRGARHSLCVSCIKSWGFQSTCPARGTTHRVSGCRRPLLISIHVPREGHDASFAGFILLQTEFQSTCPARGTTRSIRAGGGHCNISIHVPREGHDRGGSGGQPPCKRDFNPRAPRGARHGYIAALEFFDGISIHVPREGHDYPDPAA